MRISICRFSRYVKARTRFRGNTGKFNPANKQPSGEQDKSRLIAEAALRDSQRSWSRKSAEVLGIALRNDAHLEWTVLKRFAELPLHREDVDPLIPLLETRALQGSDANAFEIIGDLAVQTESVSKLSELFLVKWIKLVGETDPYRAIQLWKSYLPHNRQVGCGLYLAAQQPHAAEQLVLDEPVSNQLTRKFIEHYIETRDTTSAQRWVERWQSLSPEDVRWLHNTSRCHNVELTLPECADPPVFPESTPKIGPKLQSLTQRINALLAAHSELLEVDDIRRCWQRAMSTPSSESLNELVRLVSGQCSKKNADERWNGILRLTDSTTTLHILRVLRASLSNRAFAAAISRSPTAEHLGEILKIIPPDFICTELCLSALARRAPTLLLELIVSPELMDITLKEHHFIALWSVNPPAETKNWLVPLTLSNLDSARLMRAALHSCVFQDDRETAHKLLYEYIVTRGFTLDRRIVAAPRDKKIPKPTPSSLSETEAEGLVNELMIELFSDL